MHVTLYLYIFSDILETYYETKYNILMSKCPHVKVRKCEREKGCVDERVSMYAHECV